MHVCVPINVQCVHVMHVSVYVCVHEHACVCPSVCMCVSICVYRDGYVYPSVCVRLCLRVSDVRMCILKQTSVTITILGASGGLSRLSI